ncbi:MAG: colanic acid biosynthesis glycosyl transferase WcaI [Parvibaculaceae bacterium]
MPHLKILFITINYAPDLIGIPKYNTELAEWLVARGHEVTVVTTVPYYPEWKVKQGYKSWLWNKETINGVTVVRVPTWIPAVPTGLSRLVHLASFGVASFISAISQAVRMRPDVVIGVEPTLSAVPSVLLAAAAGRSKSWLHVQDFEVAAALALGIVKPGPISKLAIKVDIWLKRRFDLLSSISSNMVPRLIATTGNSDNVRLFQNWVECEKVFPMTTVPEFRRRLGFTEDHVVALYSGNMGNKQGLSIIAEAAHAAARCYPALRLVVCGEGPAKKPLQEATAGLDNITFLPLQPFDKFNDLLNSADIHLLPQRLAAADLVLPSKLTGMLASGRPTLACAEAGTALYEEVTDRGVCVEPENPTKFSDALISLAQSSDLRVQLGQAARERALSYWDKKAVMLTIEEGLFQLCCS